MGGLSRESVELSLPVPPCAPSKASQWLIVKCAVMRDDKPDRGLEDQVENCGEMINSRAKSKLLAFLLDDVPKLSL